MNSVSLDTTTAKLRCTSMAMALVGPLFYTTMKWGRSGHRTKRDVIGHFQKVKLVGKLGSGCLVCCQTPDNLIRHLIHLLR